VRNLFLQLYNEANTYNICRDIYLQFISQKPKRFNLLQNTTMSSFILIKYDRPNRFPKESNLGGGARLFRVVRCVNL
jgi:hypothetical protein